MYIQFIAFDLLDERMSMMSEVINVPAIFGSDVFNEAAMEQNLRPEIYSAWKQCIQTDTCTCTGTYHYLIVVIEFVLSLGKQIGHCETRCHIRQEP